MTETIGWGDVDVPVASPRRRRARGWLLWSALLAVVAGVALAPSARARLTGSAIAALDRSWAIARAYDDARSATEEHALERATAEDGLLYAQLVSLLDREEASRLRDISRTIAGRHTWTADVHSTAEEVRRALDAEAGDLDADAGRTTITFSGDLYLATPTQSGTQSLLLAAQRSVDKLVARHHIHARVHLRPGDARLTSASAVLATLDRLTNQPVHLRLAVSHHGSLDFWDLATGKGQRNIATGPDNPDFVQPLIRLGGSVLFAAADGPRMFSAAGNSRRVSLPARAEYFAAGDGTLWVVAGDSWRHYDSAGRPVGPAFHIPAGYAGGALTAAGDSLVISQEYPEAGTLSAVWTPSTGRLLPIPGACIGAVTGAPHAVAFVSCDQSSLSVMDVQSGKVETVHSPIGTVVDEAALALSPDGRRLAFLASPLNGADVNGSLALFDARTRHVNVIGHSATPLAWSPDGKTLLVSTDVGENLFSFPLGYWTDGMDRPQPIRIPITSQSVSALLLP